MVNVLASKPGLTGATVKSIPTDWDATWFRNLINNMLKGADVRNAQGANGIVVTGNIASPYGTITLGPGPIILNTPPGTVALTVNGAAGQPAIKAVAGAGGDGIDITPSSTGNAIGVSLGSATAFRALVFANSNGDFVADILANGNFEMGTFSGTQLSFYTNNATRMTIAPAAPNVGIGTTPAGWGAAYPALDFYVDAAVSGDGAARLTYNGYFNGGAWIYKTNQSIIDIEAQPTGLFLFSAPSGVAGAVATLTQQFSVDGSGNIKTSGALVSAQSAQFQNSGTTGFSGPGCEIGYNSGLGSGFAQAFNRTSSVFIPMYINSSGLTFYINSSPICAVNATGFLTGNATYLMQSSVAWTNGSGAAAGTLTNAPAAGNPTKWIAINDNGTTRHIPAW